MARSKAVSTKDEAGLPAEMEMFENDAGAGLENVTSSDLLIPRLTILQDLSPQVKQNKPEFIEGAKPGDICDVGMQELFEEPVSVIPVHFLKQWLEWAPRSSGKGLIQIHDSDEIVGECERDDKKRLVTKEGNIISETAQFFVLNYNADLRRSFIPMTSTQLKKARQWLTFATSERLRRSDGSEYQPPYYYRSYKLGTVHESNNDGDWVGWKVERGPTLQELDPENWKAIAEVAKDFRDSLVRGKARGDMSDAANEAAAAQSEGEEAM